MGKLFRKLVPAPQGAGTAGSVGAARSASLTTRVHDVLHRNATLGPLFVLILAVVIFSVAADRFLEPADLSLVV
jgi:fructose transport system permease protein